MIVRRACTARWQGPCRYWQWRYSSTQAHETHATASTDTVSNAPPKQIRLTSESYPEMKKDPKFAKLDEEHMKHFQGILDPNSIVGGLNGDYSEDLDPFNSDWMRKYKGQSQLMLKPKTTEQVSKVLKYCNEKRLAVVPQGGNTGLVGGSNPIFDEIILNISSMNNVRSFDPVSGSFVCDAGVILEVADQYLAEHGYIFPLDLGAKGSCHVGGNVSTNAGGLRLLRYGSLHGSVLGIEAVLADGTIVDDLTTIRKNNTGYDIKQLFIGSEGTLGVITGVSILCPQRSRAVNVAFLGLQSFEHVRKAFVSAKEQLQEILSAFEFLDSRSQKLVSNHAQTRFPLESNYPFYVLIETSGSNKEHDDAKLETYIESVMGDGIVEDGTLAQDETQVKSIWAWREGIPEAVNKCGGTYKYDVSLPLKDLYELVEVTGKRLRDEGVVGDTDEFPVVDCVGYGHLGDSNLHLNIGVRWYDKKVEKLLEPFVYEWISKRHGSISAEHGLGIAKRPYLSYTRNATLIQMMKGLKQHYDPNGILNPYKCF